MWQQFRKVHKHPRESCIKLYKKKVGYHEEKKTATHSQTVDCRTWREGRWWWWWWRRNIFFLSLSCMYLTTANTADWKKREAWQTVNDSTVNPHTFAGCHLQVYLLLLWHHLVALSWIASFYLFLVCFFFFFKCPCLTGGIKYSLPRDVQYYFCAYFHILWQISAPCPSCELRGSLYVSLSWVGMKHTRQDTKLQTKTLTLINHT